MSCTKIQWPPINGSNDWIGFWASYSGTVISGVITLYVLFITRSDSKKEHRTNVRNGVMPALDAFQKFGGTYDYFGERETQKYRYELSDESFIRKLPYDIKENDVVTEFYIRNIGIGPAVNLNVNVKGKKEYKSDERISLAPGDVLLYKLVANSEVFNKSEDELLNTIVMIYENIHGDIYKQEISFGVGINGKFRKFGNMSEQKLELEKK